MPPPPPPPSAPPPPGPPPPSFNSSGGAKDRSALLQSIQKGTKLKKTVTVDKSGPMISGRVSNASDNNSNAHSRSMQPSSHEYGSGNSVQMAPKLSGMFEGLSQMPKLKPVGGRTRGMTANNDSTASPTPARNNADYLNRNQINDSPMDFNSELTRRLGKRQMTQQQSNSNNENYQYFTQPPQPQRTIPKNIQSNSEPSYVPQNRFNTQRNFPAVGGAKPNPKPPTNAKPSVTPKPFGVQNTGPSRLPNSNDTSKITSTEHCDARRPQVPAPRDNTIQPIATMPKPQFNERLQETSPNISPSTLRRCPPVPPPPVPEQSINSNQGTMDRRPNIGMGMQKAIPSQFSPQRSQTQVQPRTPQQTRELPPAPQNDYNYNRSPPPPLPQRNQNNAPTQSYEYTPNMIKPIPSAVHTTKQFVIDVDAKFGHLFHDVRDFPAAFPNQSVHTMYN